MCKDSASFTKAEEQHFLKTKSCETKFGVKAFCVSARVTTVNGCFVVPSSLRKHCQSH